jgi:hypothetical protein
MNEIKTVLKENTNSADILECDKGTIPSLWPGIDKVNYDSINELKLNDLNDSIQGFISTSLSVSAKLSYPLIGSAEASEKSTFLTQYDVHCKAIKATHNNKKKNVNRFASNFIVGVGSQVKMAQTEINANANLSFSGLSASASVKSGSTTSNSELHGIATGSDIDVAWGKVATICNGTMDADTYAEYYHQLKGFLETWNTAQQLYEEDPSWYKPILLQVHLNSFGAACLAKYEDKKEILTVDEVEKIAEEYEK